MSEVVEILKRIESKLEEMDKRLRRIEEELFEELSEEETEEIRKDLEAYENGEFETVTVTSVM